MAGVRGFADPNVHITQSGKPSWFQLVDGTLSNATNFLLPFYINAAGGNISEATQCMISGSNGWQANHDAYAHGENNLWALKNSPYALGYFLRQDLQTHYALADTWTVGDMYAQSVVASTLPNRGIVLLLAGLMVEKVLIFCQAYWASGSVNVPGGPQTPDEGGTTIDNNGTPGCEAPGISCFPLKWKTTFEYLEDAGVSWKVFREHDDFGDNPADYFEQFENAPINSSLAQKGLGFPGLQAFYDAAAKGTLPQVSYIIGPMELSEHPPWSPKDGGGLQQQVVNAIIKSPIYRSTVLLLSYDETGGWGDHVLPITSPKDTPGEWMTNPFNTSETVFAGPGFRLPFTAVSPWSRGNRVYTAHSDHSSQIMFLEKWLASKGKNIVTKELNFWRREHMSDLTDLFDFKHPDFSIPHLPPAPPIAVGPQGQFLGDAECQAKFPNVQPPIPYGKQTRENSLHIETGFKTVVGALTEGRFLVFESGKSALALDTKHKELTIGTAIKTHDTPLNRFIIHATAAPPETTFNIQYYEPVNGKKSYIDSKLKATSNIREAANFEITYLGNGEGYTIKELSSKKFISISNSGRGQSLSLGKEATAFSVFSVTKSSDSVPNF